MARERYLYANMSAVIHKETSEHTHTVIFLHGKDSNSQDFADEFLESEASEPAGGSRTLPDLFPGIRWVFPQAPILHSEHFNMWRWFDICVTALLDVIKAEEVLVPRRHIYLGGISQGFATALATFFANGQGMAGLIGLCSWMPFADQVEDLKAPHAEGRKASDVSDEQLFSAVQAMYFGQRSQGESSSPLLRSTPIFLGHAKDDNIVPIKNARRMRDVLVNSLSMNVEMEEYKDGGHWVNEPQGVDDIVEFLKQTMRIVGCLREV
ncbi:uncharacterized protein AB675_1031 [Cyphellophora attinorum]|uniref:Phospholipase/carboxylesterase/thioesterase domain-containing protein n=1 Tax=Cyphellophora attinorum TaxID=1664694 RepID=A0A0N1H688_9EURO|nr:uncharacterized protein AB675_1031 [Phialophora attinorum]KPI38153.1 hypothetical protein AB675_1031 [Phialophora attinorum]